jgi:hypothetical protein
MRNPEENLHRLMPRTDQIQINRYGHEQSDERSPFWFKFEAIAIDVEGEI